MSAADPPDTISPIEAASVRPFTTKFITVPRFAGLRNLRYHPQTPISTTAWSAKVTVGAGGFSASDNETFPIHVIATSKSADHEFRTYIDEQKASGKWHGLQLPGGTKILATTTVRRNDHASTLAKLIGTYSEHRDQPLSPTGGTISISGTAHGHLVVDARNKNGQTEWRGTIAVDPGSGQVRGEYQNAISKGQGKLSLQQNADDITVTGQDSAVNAKPFYMIWKRQTS